MGFREFFSRKKKEPLPSACCACSGSSPSFHCRCHCHRVEDAEYWETIAYAWLCDIEDAAGRNEAWHRFFQAFPEWFVEELCEEFWERIRKTRWHHRHHHHHHHHPYTYGECD